MLNKIARALFTKILTPLARALLRLGLTPDAVTIIGTIGVCFGALVFYPLGQLFWGTVVITVFVFTDMLDGIMAREQGRKSAWGAFLDSSLDRFGDSAVFCGLALWFFLGGHSDLTAMLSMACLVAGSIVSYVRARGESLGASAAGGIAERSDRLLVTLLITGLVGLGLPRIVLTVALALLAAASIFTIWQRMVSVKSQLLTTERVQAETVAEREARAGTGADAAAGSAATETAATEESAVTEEAVPASPSDPRPEEEPNA